MDHQSAVLFRKHQLPDSPGGLVGAPPGTEQLRQIQLSFALKPGSVGRLIICAHEFKDLHECQSPEAAAHSRLLGWLVLPVPISGCSLACMSGISRPTIILNWRRTWLIRTSCPSITVCPWATASVTRGVGFNPYARSTTTASSLNMWISKGSLLSSRPMGVALTSSENP